MKIIVYSTQTSPRVEYIVSTLLNAIGLNEILFTNDQIFYENSSALKCNYSDNPIAKQELWIQPCTLLFEQGIHKQKIDFSKWNTTLTGVNFNSDSNKLPCFFPTTKGDLPFDIFAASFYLLTRYEEYLPHTNDMYGRYAHENSIAFQQDFLKIPLVNFWLKELKEITKQKNPEIQFSTSAFKFIPTYDIDIAWSYLHKGFVRNLGGLLKDFSKQKWSPVKERIQVLLRKKKDPFDSYDWLHTLHESKEVQPIYFFLLAQKNRGYDKNILPENVALQQLIKVHSGKYKVGIHPSWQSGEDEQILKEETALLEKITGRNIYQSRQHYIRMTLPDTYRKLLSVGITNDYSMGYGSINGFRASYCLPYKWYDLQSEKTTNLTIHPFCYMDANSFYEQHFTAEQSLEEMKYYYQIVKEVNGELITIWHNHFLGADKTFEGWKEIYDKMLSLITT